MRVRSSPSGIGVNLLNRGMITTGYTKLMTSAMAKNSNPPMSHHESNRRMAQKIGTKSTPTRNMPEDQPLELIGRPQTRRLVRHAMALVVDHGLPPAHRQLRTSG